jgi:hypothetical protein
MEDMKSDFSIIEAVIKKISNHEMVESFQITLKPLRAKWLETIKF